MKAGLSKLAVSVALFWSPFLKADDKRIRVRGDLWCPYNCDPLSHVKRGSMIEMLEQALEPAGYSIDYSIMPWEQSLKAARDGSVDAVVGLTLGDAQGFVLPTEPQGIGITCFYGKKGAELDTSGFHLSRIEQLLTHRIVIPSGHAFVESLQAYVTSHKDDEQRIRTVSGNWPLVDSYRAVFNDEAQLFPENEAVIDHLLISLGVRGGGQMKSMGCLEGEKLYVGFSGKRADAKTLADILAKKMTELRKSGELARLLARYKQKDWN